MGVLTVKVKHGNFEVEAGVLIHHVLYEPVLENVLDMSSKPKVFLLQGSMSDCRRKTSVQDTFASAGFDVLTFDHRGMGQSTMDTDETHYKMLQYASDAFALLSHVGWSKENFNIIGVSFGGMVAQELLINFQEKLPNVNKAVFACSPAKLSAQSREIGDTAAELSTYSFVRNWVSKLDSRFSTFFGYIVAVLAGAFASVIPAVKHIDASAREVYWGKCRIYQLRARSKHNTLDRLGNIEHMDILVSGGSRDLTAPPESMNELADQLVRSRAKVRIFDGGHLFYSSSSALKAFVEFFSQP